ncbi:WxL domain-containing protein [Enterococcus sp. LJL120]
MKNKKQIGGIFGALLLLVTVVLVVVGNTQTTEAAPENSRALELPGISLTSEPSWGGAVSIASQADLQTAIDNPAVNHVILTSSFALSSRVVISRDFYIDGNGFAITVANGNNGLTLGAVSGLSGTDRGYFKLENLKDFGTATTAAATVGNAFIQSDNGGNWSIHLLNNAVLATNAKPIVNAASSKVLVETTTGTSTYRARNYSLATFSATGGEIGFVGANTVVLDTSYPNNPIVDVGNGKLSFNGGNNNFSGTTGARRMFTGGDITVSGSMTLNKVGSESLFEASNSFTMQAADITMTQAGSNTFNLIRSTSTVNPVKIIDSSIVSTSGTTNSLGGLINTAGNVEIDGLTMSAQGYDWSTTDTGRYYVNNNFITAYQNISVKNSKLNLNVGGEFALANYNNPTNPTGDYEGDSLVIDNSTVYGLYNGNFTNAKKFQITNDSLVNTLHGASVYNSEIHYANVTFDGRSQVTMTGDGDFNMFRNTGDYSQVNFLGDAALGTTEGNTTVKITGRSNNTGDSGGVFSYNTGSRGNSTPVYLNFKDYVTVSVTSNGTNSANTNGTPSVMIQAQGAQFNVENHSIVDFTNYGDSNSRGAIVRFRYSGDSSFNVSGNSIMRLTKNNGTSRAAAVRMNGGGNSINVSDGGKFYVTNNDETRSNGNGYDGGVTNGSDGAFAESQAIQFINGNSEQKVNTFSLVGDESVVRLYANAGAAIDAASDIDVIAGAGTFFEAIGNTNGGAIFRNGAGHLNFEMSAPMYYDFRNNAPRGGNLITSANTNFIAGRSSKFESTASDVSFWNKLSNLDGTPTYSRTLISYTLRGANMTLAAADSPDDDFSNRFGIGNGVNQYSRISANNSNPTIDQIRQGTDADLSLYVLGTVMEGFDLQGHRVVRPWWDEETNVVVEITEPNKAPYQLTQSSLQGPISIYNDLDQSGYVKFELTDYLPAGTTVKVVSAWRGEADAAEDQRHNTPQTEIDALPAMTVTDVTPPQPATITGDQVTNATTKISGTAAEPGANVYYAVKKSGESQPTMQTATAVVAADGSWELSLTEQLAVGDELSLYFEDTAGDDAQVSDIDLASNTGIGNINPYTELTYHDATFPVATRYIVQEALVQHATAVKTYTSSGGTSVSVGDTLTYQLVVANTETAGSGILWGNVVMTDVIDEGLTFDPDTATVTVAGTSLTTDQFSYDQDSRTLTVPLGDILPKTATDENVVTITFTGVVNSQRVGEKIRNQAHFSGENARGDEFAIDSNLVETTDEVYGILSLDSAPNTINFGSQQISEKATEVDNPIYDQDVIVTDNRAVQSEWKLQAQITKPLTIENGNPLESFDVLSGVIKFRNGASLTTLSASPETLITQTNPDRTPYNVSATWSAGTTGFELYVPNNVVRRIGKYTGEIFWQLSDVYTP